MLARPSLNLIGKSDSKEPLTLVAAASNKGEHDDSKETNGGDYQKYMKGQGGDYQKYMQGQGQGGSQGGD